MMKKIYALLLLFCLVITAACSKQQSKPEKDTVRLQGKTEAVFHTIKAPVEGSIRGLILDKGERIRKGQPLFGLGAQEKNPEAEKAAEELAKAQARLNNASRETNEASRATAEASIQNAQNRVRQAEQQYAKMQRLFSVGGISKKMLTQSQLDLESARASLSAAQSRLQQLTRVYTPEEKEALKKQVEEAKASYDAVVLTIAGSEIASPATGIVQEIWCKNGDPVKPEQPVMQILSSTDCFIKATAATADSRLKEGMEASITAAGIRKPFSGKIHSLNQNNIILFSDQKPEEIPGGTAVEITIALP